NRRAVLVQRDNRLLPVRQPSEAEAIAALLAEAILRPHLLDANLGEQLLHRCLDLFLGRPLVDLERIGMPVRRLVRALFRHQRAQQHLMRFELRPAVRVYMMWICHDPDSREHIAPASASLAGAACSITSCPRPAVLPAPPSSA